MKFTFKTYKATGQYGCFHSDFHDVKLKRKVVGTIDDEFPHKIRLMVVKDNINEDGNPNCLWMWITLAEKSETLDKAKEFLRTNTELIIEKYKLVDDD